MKRDAIITLPHAHLRQKSRRVTRVSREIKTLIKNMESATLDWEDHRPHEIGVALAAIQIDQSYRAVIIRQSFDDKDDRTFCALLNP